MESSTFYYVHNRSVSPEILFRTEENKSYFSRKIQQYISHVAIIHEQLLLEDSFHLLVEIKDQDELKHARKIRPPKSERGAEKYVIQQFGNLLNCYAQSYNKMFKRSGALFRKNMCHQPIEKSDFQITKEYIRELS